MGKEKQEPLSVSAFYYFCNVIQRFNGLDQFGNDSPVNGKRGRCGRNQMTQSRIQQS